MNTPINLNKARKIKARAQKRAQADANSMKHGRTSAQKAAEGLQIKTKETHLNQHKVED